MKRFLQSEGPAIGGAESREDEGAAAWAAKRRLRRSFVHASRYENREGKAPRLPASEDGPSMRVHTAAVKSRQGVAVGQKETKGGGGAADGAFTNASALLFSFLAARAEIDSALKPLLEQLSTQPIIVLAVNSGVLDLVMNVRHA